MADVTVNNNWDLTPKEAVELQKSLQSEIKLSPEFGHLETVRGADVSFSRGSDRVHAGIVVLRLADLKLLACSLVTAETSFPYIPGLLAFREIPPLAKAWKRCAKKPDLLIFDGHGIAHPRRVGLATHFGILRDVPTVGCAKKVLTGEYEMPDSEKGSTSILAEEGERLGTVLRSRTDVKPIFVSPGHKTDFESSVEIVKRCLTKYRLPETTRKAHSLVNRLRKGEAEEGYHEFNEKAAT